MAIATPTTLLRTNQVCEILGVCRATLYNLRRRGEFPNGIEVGGQRRWRVTDIDAWIDKQAAA